MTPIPTALSGGSRVILPVPSSHTSSSFFSIHRHARQCRDSVEHDVTRARSTVVSFFSFSFLESYLADFEILSLPRRAARRPGPRACRDIFETSRARPRRKRTRGSVTPKARGRQSRAPAWCRCARVRRRTKRTKRTCERCARERWTRTNRRAADARAGASDAAGHVSEATASSPRVEGRSWRSRWRR